MKHGQAEAHQIPTGINSLRKRIQGRANNKQRVTGETEYEERDKETGSKESRISIRTEWLGKSGLSELN